MKLVYQAKAGDGFHKKGLKRTNSFFKTPQEAISEVLALKEKMDVTYKNKIKWDYSGDVTGKPNKLKVLRGYLGGDKESTPFYLQILSVEQVETASFISPIEPKKITKRDKDLISRVTQLFA